MDSLHHENVVNKSSYCDPPYVAQGMPELGASEKQTSFFEFWPTWVMYLPVFLQTIVLALRHRSLMLPLIANPKLPLSGMVGVEKSRLMEQAGGECEKAILPWFIHVRSNADLVDQVKTIEVALAEHQLDFPVVCKPDIGCRGTGVKLVHNPQQLAEILNYYPEGAGIMLQKLSSWEPEAGVFYVRKPNEPRGTIVSLALKYSPYVVGDGRSTLRQLIEMDSRAGELKQLYFERHKIALDKVITDGEPYRLVFAASHCRGAIFRDARQYITPQLTQRIDEMMQDLPEFYYGRLDIKFRDIDSFTRGENMEIVEINSASSESLHIWDRNTSFSEAMRALLFQYRTLFDLGAQNRARGFRPPAFSSLLSAWRKERQLTQTYPETD